MGGKNKTRERIRLYEDITKKYYMLTSDELYTLKECSPSRILRKEEILELWRKDLKEEQPEILSLYVHIPFCKSRRCYYCLYASTVLKEERQIDGYLDYVEREIRFFSPLFSDKKFLTLYTGGGTPSVLSVEQLERLMDLIFENFKFRGGAVGESRSVEVSPGTITREKVLLLKKRGINRLSMGIQSIDEEVMRSSNRLHIPFELLKEIIGFIKKQDFKEFNVDLLAGLPDDTIEKFKTGLERMMELSVPSIIVYFYRHQEWRFKDKEWCRKFFDYKAPYEREELFEALKGLAKRHNYLFPEVSPYYDCWAFVKKGHKLIVDLSVPRLWGVKNSILGIGMVSQSFVGHSSEYYPCNNEVGSIDFGDSKYKCVSFSEDYDMRDFMVRSLDAKGKVSMSEFRKIFKKEMLEVFREEIDALKKLGKVKIEGDYLIFTTKDMFEFCVYEKFFYDQSYLKRLAKGL